MLSGGNCASQFNGQKETSVPDLTIGQRVAIAGATGYIGGRLAPRLLSDGYKVRCLVRTPEKLAERAWAANPDVEIWPADLSDSASLTKSLAGCQTAFYLVHSMTSAGAEYVEQDRHLALQFATAARDAGVGRIVYLGGLGETGANLSDHLASRREVEKDLASTGVPVTVLRAAMIIGSGSASHAAVGSFPAQPLLRLDVPLRVSLSAVNDVKDRAVPLVENPNARRCYREL